MNAPKNRHSDERKSHIASFVLLMPVLVAWASWPCSGDVVRGRDGDLAMAHGSVCGLDGPRVHAEQDHQGADGTSHTAWNTAA